MKRTWKKWFFSFPGFGSPSECYQVKYLQNEYSKQASNSQRESPNVNVEVYFSLLCFVKVGFEWVRPYLGSQDHFVDPVLVKDEVKGKPVEFIRVGSKSNDQSSTWGMEKYIWIVVQNVKELLNSNPLK